MAYPILDDEAERLGKLRALMVLDSAPEPVFDDIARLASEVCGAPIALLSLIDAERQWFKANVGLPGVNETPRDVAFCAHAIAHDTLFSVPDATQDPRFADNPLVTGAPDIRFYAGAPLVMPGGERVGTLCVIDRQVRVLSAAQQQMLASLAGIATQALEMRRELTTRALLVRSQYEEALAESESRYRAIVEEQSELISLSREDGTLVFVNRAYARHFGLLPAQMQDTNLFDYVEPADREAVVQQLQQVLRSGTAHVGENRMVSADGQARWVAWTNSLQFGAQGERLLHSVGRDITEQRQAAQALHASQSFLQRTGRVAGVGGWELVLATGAVFWSEETRRIHGVGPDYVPTLDSAVAFYAPAARHAIEAAVQRGMEQGQPWDLELPFVSATGRALWVRAVGEMEFEHGQPVRLIGAFQDITERKQLAQRLADSERFVRQVTDGVPMRLAYADSEQRFRFVNQAHCARFGLAREQIIGRTRSELTGGLTDDAILPRVQAVLAGQPQRFEYEEVAAGVKRRIESQLIPDVGDDGQVRGFFSTGVDITERAAAERALRELTAIFDNTPDWVVQTDWKGRISYMNPAVRRALGLAAGEDVSQHNFTEFNTPATNALFAQTIAPAVKAHGMWLGDTTVFARGRREVPVSHMVLAHRDASGRVERYSAVMRDISVTVEAQRQFQRQTATLRAVTEAIPAIVAVVGGDQRYRFVNRAFERWLGVHRDDIIGRTLQAVLSPAAYEASRAMAERALAGETVSFEREHIAQGRLHHLALSYTPLWLDNGQQDGFIGVAQDITQHKQEEVRLLQLSQRDPLTGLINRAGFEAYMEAQLHQGAGAALALLYIDLDHFKPVNDQHGHPVGDKVLQEFAQRLQKLVRPTDAVARLGGDEFAVALAGVRHSSNARKVADKVIEAASEPFMVSDLCLRIGASVGVSFGADPVTGWGDLVQRADAMLYAAKAGGRGRHAVGGAH